MTRRRKIISLVLTLLIAGGVGGFSWYWHATTIDRKVRQLVYEAAGYPDTRTEKTLKNWRLGFLLKEKPKPRNDDVILNEIKSIGHSATPELLSLLQNENEWLRCKTVDFLGEVGDERAVEPLIQILQRNDKDPNPADHAIAALGNLHDIRALEPLNQAREKEILSLREEYGNNEYRIFNALLRYWIAIHQIESACATRPSASSPTSQPK